jgi:two-component system sensor kinase FixL
MNNPIKKYRVIASAIWVCTVLLSFLWNHTDDIREKNAMALETARAFLTHIVAVRTWNAEHGGVFVFTDEKAPVNPYLPDDQQFIVTNDGRQLTKVNPAYMTRQISDIAAQQSKVRFHLTSRDPIRPANKAVDWEEEWLKDFEKGIPERSGFVKTPGGEIFRYMAPLRVTAACLSCHDSYSAGEVRGGLSVSMPFHYRKTFWPLLISHVGAAIMGLLVIQFFASRLGARSKQFLATNQRLVQEIEEHKESEEELVKIKDELELRVASRTAELSRINRLLDAKIKEQQQVEKALVEINDEYIQIFNSAPDGMHIIDRDYTVVRANRAFVALTGHSSAEAIVGRKCYEVFGGRLCRTQECPLARILEGAERVEVEVRKVRADGSTFPCVATANPFRATSGKLIGIIEVSRDISRWKDAETALSRVAQDLLLRNQELQEFSHVISHDLQEPLMLIQAFSQRLQDNFLTNLSDKGKVYLERILSSAERMQMLINGLLSYSRIEKESQPFIQVHLNNIIQAVLEDLTVKIEESDATISAEDLGSVMADPLQMRQLFQNIIGNSLKYRHPDRVPEIWMTRILLEGYDPNNYLSISIKDNGIGFKEEYQEKIFDIFQRLHTRQQFNGTGLGLSICKKIVERHHGVISATAVEGQGAEFIITLPLIPKLRQPLVEMLPG